jgi:hypothetical protein
MVWLSQALVALTVLGSFVDQLETQCMKSGLGMAAQVLKLDS